MGANYLEDMDKLLKNILQTPTQDGMRESKSETLTLQIPKHNRHQSEDERKSIAKIHDLFEYTELEK